MHVHTDVYRLAILPTYVPVEILHYPLSAPLKKTYLYRAQSGDIHCFYVHRTGVLPKGVALSVDGS
jgi:hypothetical protein